MIAHLDADCFYASAERVRHPFLMGKPVGVIGNQGACVIAKSYEMKASGVATGEPIWDAVKKCPDGVYVKRDFRWYEALSKKMLDLVRRWSPAVEYYSVDEFFLSVDVRDPQKFAESIRDEVLKAVGVPVTIGIARTKTLAKLISDNAKPFGALALVGEAAEHDLLASRAVSDITGIAKRSAVKLAMLGIRTCLDFARANPKQVRKVLTVVGEKLCYECNGEKVLPIQTTRPPHKMISRGGSIGEPSPDPMKQWAWVVRNLERLIEALDFHGIMAGKLLLILEYKHGPSTSASVRFEAPTSRYDTMVEAVKIIWQRALETGRLYRMHLIASELQYPGARQLGLFDSTKPDVAKLKEAVNERMGRFALRSAATLPLEEIYSDFAHGYDICDIAGKTCF